MLSCSNCVRVMLLQKSMSSESESTSTVVCLRDDRAHLARSHATRSRRNAHVAADVFPVLVLELLPSQ